MYTKLLEKGKGNIKWIMSKSKHEWPLVTTSKKAKILQWILWEILKEKELLEKEL